MITWANATMLWYFVLGLFIFFWIFTLLRVAKDISRRTKHLGMQILSLFVIVLLTPIVWLPVYFLLRPLPRYELLDEQDEIKDLMSAQNIICTHCDGPNLYEHTFCVFCGEKLKNACRACWKQVALWYFFCPFCAANLDEETEEKWEDTIASTKII
jgi:hypothetical protein